MDFLGRNYDSQEPNHLHGIMFLIFLCCFLFLYIFCTSSSTFICFPIPVFGLLFVSSHVGLYLIIVLLFLCQQFIPLPCHLITRCVNSVLPRHHSLPMMLLSGLLTCVDARSFIRITAQVNRLRLRLVGPLSREPAQQQIRFCFFVHPPVFYFSPPCYLVLIHYSPLSPPPQNTKYIYFLLPYCLFISSFATQLVSDLFVFPSLLSTTLTCSPSLQFVFLQGCKQLDQKKMNTFFHSCLFLTGWWLDLAFLYTDTEEGECGGWRTVHLHGWASFGGVPQKEAHHPCNPSAR